MFKDMRIDGSILANNLHAQRYKERSRVRSQHFHRLKNVYLWQYIFYLGSEHRPQKLLQSRAVLSR